MKMKKLITNLLPLPIVLSLAACGSNDNSNSTNHTQGNC